MLFRSWKEKIREFFEPYDNKKNREAQKLIPNLATNENNNNIYKDGTIVLFLYKSIWIRMGVLGNRILILFQVFRTNGHNNKIIQKNEKNITYWNVKVVLLHIGVAMKKVEDCRLNIFPINN